MNFFKKSIERFKYFFINILILIISYTIPKSKKIVIVGGWFGERFADNSKFFYLYLNDNLNELGFNKVIWITRSDEIKEELTINGYQVYNAWSFCSIWYHLRAKYHIIDQSPKDINSFFSVRSKRVNLWHGFPLKKIGYYTELKPTSKKNKLQKLFNKLTSRGFWSDYLMLSTSDFSAEIIGKAFDIEKAKVIISGYPRNYEPLINKPVNYIPRIERLCYQEIHKYKSRGYKIIGYFPTFRDKKETLAFGTKDILEINLFLDYCEKRKIKFVGKFHFAGKNDKFGEIRDHKTFINLPSESDVYTFFNQLDVIITDYSSIYFDFLLWNRPIIFFPYDLDYYRNEDRGLIFNYEEFTPGPKVYNLDQLKTLLTEDIDLLTERYEKEFRENADILKIKIFGDYNNMGIKHLINILHNQTSGREKEN